jgi:hypothetical protein
MRYLIYLFLMAGMAAAGDPNGVSGEPNVPREILAEGVVAVEMPDPALTALAAATDVPAFRYRLTYRAKELIDRNSWDVYQLYFVSDPNHPEREPDAAFLREQLALGPETMNLDKLAAHFEACGEKLALLEQAVRCRVNRWPNTSEPERDDFMYFGMGVPPARPEQPALEIKNVPTLLAQLDAAGLLLSAKARYHIARGDYDEACRWLRAGLAQGRQMTNDTDALAALAGAVNVGRVLGQIEMWVERSGSPSLFRAMGDLPRPLISFAGVREKDRTSNQIWREPYDILEVEPGFLKASPRIVQAIERLVAALQCVEAVRLHAALNEGRFPAALGEITEVRVPLDPVTRQAFGYSLDGGVMTLTAEKTESGSTLELRYRIIHEQIPDFYGMPGMGMF